MGNSMQDPRIFYQMPPLIPGTTSSTQPTVAPLKSGTAKNPFAEVLQKEITQVKFSQHALQRLDSREIKLDESQLQRLAEAVDKAEQKGARESLVLMDDQLAFVVSVRNRTVITAMDGTSLKENVFTNIDSAVIM